MITAKRLREIVIYNSETGIFTARVGRRGISVGATMGSVNKSLGYVEIGVDMGKYSAHRLAWFYVTGKWPEKEIDHINGDRADNRLLNLREATSLQNKANRPVRCDSKLGKKGLHQIPSGSYRVRVRKEGKIIHDKCYADIRDAEMAYLTVAKMAYGEFARA